MNSFAHSWRVLLIILTPGFATNENDLRIYSLVSKSLFTVTQTHTLIYMLSSIDLTYIDTEGYTFVDMFIIIWTYSVIHIQIFTSVYLTTPTAISIMSMVWIAWAVYFYVVLELIHGAWFIKWL